MGRYGGLICVFVFVFVLFFSVSSFIERFLNKVKDDHL